MLASRPFILGGRFTLADAAIYGQLGMNLPDPSADAANPCSPEQASTVNSVISTFANASDPSQLTGRLASALQGMGGGGSELGLTLTYLAGALFKVLKGDPQTA